MIVWLSASARSALKAPLLLVVLLALLLGSHRGLKHGSRAVGVLECDAAVTVPGYFADNMVLQTNQHYGARSFLWGTSLPGEQVTVRVSNQKGGASIAGNVENGAGTYVVYGDSSGSWIVTINPTKASLNGYTISIEGAQGGSFVAANVSFGDVYMCVGDKDMGFPLSLSRNATAEIAGAATFPYMRVFKMTAAAASAPTASINGTWVPISPSSVADVSAICYLTAKNIAQARNDQTPIGIIQATVDDVVPMSAWTPAKVLSSCNATARGSFIAGLSEGTNTPSAYWNGIINPFSHYTLRAAWWYQGSYDALKGTSPALFSCMFQGMIGEWRRIGKYGDFSFVYMQLPPLSQSGSGASASTPAIRQAQSGALPQPGGPVDTTGMAVSIDIAQPSAWGPGFPFDKETAARRMAAQTLHVAFSYQQQWNNSAFSGVFASPTPISVNSPSTSGGSLGIILEPWTATGLYARDVANCSLCCAKSSGFQVLIAASQTWLNVSVKTLSSSAIVLNIPNVEARSANGRASSQITMVRYGWSDCVECAYANSNEFVLSPFVMNVSATQQARVKPQALLLPARESAQRGPLKGPPMGYNTWNFYHCNVNENVVLRIADALIQHGLSDLGYSFVNIDDCWQTARMPNGTIVPDPARFPSGMYRLTQEIHAKGMLFGLYTARGAETCQNRPGSRYYNPLDAETYCSFDIDYIKIDQCVNEGKAKPWWTTFHQSLQQCYDNGGPYIVMSVETCNGGDCMNWVADVADLWRTTGDIQANFPSVLSNAKNNNKMAAVAKPGHYNDADMLQVGNPGLSFNESKSHFALWCVMSSPLLIGTDIIDPAPSTLEILSAKELISVNQDEGVDGKVQGVMVADSTSSVPFSVWVKPLSTGATAVIVVNEGSTSSYSLNWKTIGLPAGKPFHARDIWLEKDLGTFSDEVTAVIPSHDCFCLLLTPA